MSAMSPSAPPIPRSRRVWFRVGLVAAGLMGLFNLVNGMGSLADPTFGQGDPSLAPQPSWISVGLVLFGALTLSALIPAWRWVRWAILVVVSSRLAEAWSAVVLPFLPDAPSGIALFAFGLVAVGTAVSFMVAQGLRTGA